MRIVDERENDKTKKTEQNFDFEYKAFSSVTKYLILAV